MADSTAFADADSAARSLAARVGPELRIALPLGLGKPVTLLNILTGLAAEDRGIRLSIFTALTLERPEPSSDVERRFLDPAMLVRKCVDKTVGCYGILPPQYLETSKISDQALPPVWA